MIWLDCMEQTMNSRTRGKGTVVGVHIYRRPLALISRVMSPTCAQSEPSPVIAVIKSRWFFKHLVSLRFYKKQMFLSPGNKHMKHIVASLSGLQLPGNNHHLWRERDIDRLSGTVPKFRLADPMQQQNGRKAAFFSLTSCLTILWISSIYLHFRHFNADFLTMVLIWSLCWYIIFYYRSSKKPQPQLLPRKTTPN